MDGIGTSKRSYSNTFNNNEPETKKRCADESKTKITVLPPEMLVEIFSNLSFNDLVACRGVSTQWMDSIYIKRLVEVKARSYYNKCHPTKPTLHFQQSVESYRSTIRKDLENFGPDGKKAKRLLDDYLDRKHKDFPEILFFMHAIVLASTKAFICEPITTITYGSFKIVHSSFSPDGQHVATVSNDDTAIIWGLVDGQKKAILEHLGRVNSASFSPDGNYLMTISTFRNYNLDTCTFTSCDTVKIWKLVDGECLATNVHSGKAATASFSPDRPDGKRFATISALDLNSESDNVNIWELVNGKWRQIQTIKYSKRGINTIFSPNGNYLATTFGDNIVKILEFVNGKWLEVYVVDHSGDVLNVRFSPDGMSLATVSKDKTSKILGLDDGKWQEKALIQHSQRVSTVNFSPDGKSLVTASENRTAQIWRDVGGEWQKQNDITHSSWVLDAQFSPDGNHIMTVCLNKTVRISNKQGLEKDSINYSGVFEDAQFSPDGQYLRLTFSDKPFNDKPYGYHREFYRLRFW